MLDSPSCICESVSSGDACQQQNPLCDVQQGADSQQYVVVGAAEAAAPPAGAAAVAQLLSVGGRWPKALLLLSLEKLYSIARFLTLHLWERARPVVGATIIHASHTIFSCMI